MATRALHKLFQAPSVSTKPPVSRGEVLLQLLQYHHLVSLITAVVQGCISIAICSKHRALHAGTCDLHWPHGAFTKQVAIVSSFTIFMEPSHSWQMARAHRQSLRVSQSQTKMSKLAFGQAVICSSLISSPPEKSRIS